MLALFRDFEKIMKCIRFERLETEVVKDQGLGATERFEDARTAAVAARKYNSSQSLGQQ